MANPWKEIGKEMKTLRLSRGMSQQQIADYLQIPRQSVTLLEDGKRELGFLEAVAFCKLVLGDKTYKQKMDNFLKEIASMIESGSIIVGPLGLSQDSADFVFSMTK